MAPRFRKLIIVTNCQQRMKNNTSFHCPQQIIFQYWQKRKINIKMKQNQNKQSNEL
tara:strand:- start:1431 stop:1598 length:168 start_codon:yes stop_codon:yes gene_type:complete